MQDINYLFRTVPSPALRDLTKFQVRDSQDNQHNFIRSHTLAPQSQMPYALSLPRLAGALNSPHRVVEGPSPAFWPQPLMMSPLTEDWVEPHKGTGFSTMQAEPLSKFWKGGTSPFPINTLSPTENLGRKPRNIG